MYEHKIKLENITREVDQALKKIDLPRLTQEIEDLNLQTLSPDFWQNPENAQQISKQLAALQKEKAEWERIASDVEEVNQLFPTVKYEENPEEGEELKAMIDELDVQWRKLEVRTFLNGKYDACAAIMSIHAGTGGKDAMDFVDLLTRMYLRYAEEKGWSAEIFERSPGEEVGTKSITIHFSGLMPYGYLKCEKGVHRLVRNSPFNAKNSRETSFALVEVMPDVDTHHEVVIKPEDLRVDTFRSGGAGGQNVNKVSSAVRLTHLPSGLVVACQSERSQHQNKEQAMKILKGRLIELAEKQQVAELSQIKGERVEMSWGNQIRSYVLHPYTMVKDHRTDHEERDVNAVLDGSIDGFIEAELKK